MMSIVGGDFTGQAAAAASLGIQPGTLIATNTNNLYGFAHMGGLQQQLLQQSAAAAVFQNYTEAMDNDDVVNNAAGIALMSGVGTSTVVDDEQQQVYGQLDDGYDDAGAVDGGGMSDLEPKQEIINIDDFVMMNEENNSYDDTDFMTSSDKDISQSSSSCMTSLPTNHDLLMPLGDGLIQQKHLLLGAPTTTATSSLSGINIAAAASNNAFANILVSAAAAAGDNVNGIAAAGDNGQKSIRSTAYSVTASSSGKAGNGAASSSSSIRSQRKTRKIEPVNRPGLVLKTPIAYKGNIDPSVIPIQKDGMGMFSIFLHILFSHFYHFYFIINMPKTNCHLFINGCANLGLGVCIVYGRESFLWTWNMFESLESEGKQNDGELGVV